MSALSRVQFSMAAATNLITPYPKPFSNIVPPPAFLFLHCPTFHSFSFVTPSTPSGIHFIHSIFFFQVLPFHSWNLLSYCWKLFNCYVICLSSSLERHNFVDDKLDIVGFWVNWGSPKCSTKCHSQSLNSKIWFCAHLMLITFSIFERTTISIQCDVTFLYLWGCLVCGK